MSSETTTNNSTTSNIETNLVVVKEVQVFKIPPRQSNRGYRAADWDVNQFLWKGRLRVVSQGETCMIKLEDPITGQLFAQCKHEPQANTVEQVTDSSRYFVIKIEDAASGRHAFVGLGFQERNDSFDFNVALQDHYKNLKLTKEASNAPVPVAVDYSLKEGAKINIKIGGIATKKQATTNSSNVEPSQGQARQQPQQTQQNAPNDWVQF